MAGPRIEVECGQGQRLSVLSFRVPIWTVSGSFLPVGVVAVCPAALPAGYRARTRVVFPADRRAARC